MKLAILLLTLPAMSLAQQLAIGGYYLPTAFSDPIQIAAGPDGALWFTEWAGNKIGRITNAGVVTEYPIPTANSQPQGIAAGPDGALWFTESSANKIGRISTTGDVTEYPLTAGSTPFGITSGPDGALWFTEEVNQIGRITLTGVVTQYPMPAGYYDPIGIITGPDGALWFTEWVYYANGIGRLTTDGVFTEYPLPAYSEPWDITSGSDGALWFTEAGSIIGRITTAGVISQYPVPTSNPGLSGITATPDGALWFAESVGRKIGRIATSGAITEYPMPAGDSGPASITTGADGGLWFTEGSTVGPITTIQTIGQAVFTTASLGVTPASGYYKSNLVFTGTGFAANENVEIYKSGVGSAVLASAKADGTGSFSVAVDAPQWPYGPRIFQARGQSSRFLGAANFSMAPRLILNPGTGTAGGTVTAVGYGFGSLEAVKVYWNNPRILLGTVTADVHGTFNGSAGVTFTVPSGAPAGKNGVFGHGESTGAIGSGSLLVQ